MIINSNGDGNGSYIPKRRCEVRRGGLLNEWCRNQGLLLGQYALVCAVEHVQYFQQYGLDKRAFDYLLKNSDEFAWQVCSNGHSRKEVIQRYADTNGIRVTWCPQYIHVYEMLQRRYRYFGWVVDTERRIVRFRNYPRHEYGKPLTLYDLASGLVAVDLDYQFVKTKKPYRIHRRRRRTMTDWSY